MANFAKFESIKLINIRLVEVSMILAHRKLSGCCACPKESWRGCKIHCQLELIS